MAFQGMLCPLGNHLLKRPGVFITNPRHISFVQKLYPNFRRREEVCKDCKQIVEQIYNIKYQRALQLRRTKSLEDISSLSGSKESKRETDDSLMNVIDELSSLSSPQPRTPTQRSYSTENSDQPTTSHQAEAIRKRRDDLRNKPNDENMPGINILRGARLPHIQPTPRRRQVVYLNPDIMDIYLRGITGG